MPGTLYIVATPIGNLEDITLRALRILKEADLVAAEDTRHTNKLLMHYAIETPLIAYHQHSDAGRTANLIRRMAEENQSIALVTDAGTPGVSDPGVELVCAAQQAGITVVPIPGASAALCALVGSGLPPARFGFEGFLPRTKSSRREKLAVLAGSETRTLIFYEAGNRTLETLKEMQTAFGDMRHAAVCRELTKKHEEFVRGTLPEIIAHFEISGVRGEVTIVVAGKTDEPEQEQAILLDSSEEGVSSALKAALAAGLSERDAVRQISERLHLGRREVYSAMIALKNQA